MDSLPMPYEMEQLQNEILHLKKILQDKENIIVQITYQNQQLQKDQFQLEETIQHQENKHAQIKYELEQQNLELNIQITNQNQQLQKHKLQLEETIRNQKYDLERLNLDIYDMGNKIAQLSNELHSSNSINHEMMTINDDLKRKNGELQEVNKRLLKGIKQLKQRECCLDCVSHAILCICQSKVLVEKDFQLCRNQIENILINYAGIITNKENLKCGNFIEILKMCRITKVAAEYSYPDINAKDKKLDEAWNKLFATDGNKGVLILATTPANGVGHVEVCDLNTRFDESVTIHDPQNDKWVRVNKQEFKIHVINSERLVLFEVSIEKFKEIMREHESILHDNKQSEQTFTIFSYL